jgi:hypothetical protein
MLILGTGAGRLQEGHGEDQAVHRPQVSALDPAVCPAQAKAVKTGVNVFYRMCGVLVRQIKSSQTAIRLFSTCYLFHDRDLWVFIVFFL